MSGEREFQRWVAADWSGAGHDAKSNRGLAVATCSLTEPTALAAPQPRSRQRLTEWIAQVLRPRETPTLLGLDFGFGYPSPAASVVFGANSWYELPGRMAALLDEHHTARDLAHTINEEYHDGGPFRITDRVGHRFYVRHGVPYYRLTEQFAPQAISQWYLGKGATVGFSSITGLACLGRLMSLRQKGDVDFAVFPFEEPTRARHVVAEIYPALYPSAGTQLPRGHGHDAMKSARWLRKHCAHRDSLKLPSIQGLDDDMIFSRALEEGWILGIGVPIIGT